MTLRIAWVGLWEEFSPVALRGRPVVDALAARGHNVGVFRAETGAALDRTVLPAPGPLGKLAEISAEELRDHAIVIVQFPLDPTWIPLLARGGWVIVIDDPAAPTEAADRLAANAIGAVAHDEATAARLRAACSGPVAILRPVHADQPVPPPRPIRAPLTVAAIGPVAAGNGLEELVTALGASALLRDARLKLIGQAEPDAADRLLRLAARHGARPPELLGALAEQPVREMLGEIDAICLLGGALPAFGTGSLAGAALTARPVLAAGGPALAGYPDDALLRCAPGQPALHVIMHLENMLTDPAAARAIGRRGRAAALRLHGPERFVDGLLRLIDAACPGAPAILAAKVLGRELAGFGIGPDDPAAERAAAALAELMRPPASA